MDQTVIQYYRRLLRQGFAHAGSIEKPTLFLDTVRENIPICGHVGDYLNVTLMIQDNWVVDIKYLCNCDPAANVAVEILCGLVKGKKVEEIKSLTEEPFFMVLGGKCEDLGQKAKGLLELLSRGFQRVQAET
jgi:NifU-like protein involved in Fe-S cluster formation